MPTTFAVIDAGSNAIRLQIAAVEQAGAYRIIEQERRPARLGHNVFETGALDPSSRNDALDALKRFKNIADRHGVAAIRAIATSAMREARDGPSFIEEVARLGITLEVLSEEEEARLISVGILSGLKFDPPLGLFIDIGGGSVELAVGNHSKMLALFSVPLGAVRLTERFLKHDPPTARELDSLERFVKQKLGPASRRICREKYTMVFGSGGTMTSLADMDARLTGETHHESLYVLRRGRLKSLFELLRSQPLQERAASIAGDPRRADILVAGAGVVLSMMTQLELDYIFVSVRGLRDGLMVNLLRTHHPAFPGIWTEETNRSESIEEVGEKYNYDKTHSQQVSRLSRSLFEQLRDLHGLPERYSSILHAAAMLHDIGLFIAYQKHHKHTYYLIKSSGPGSFDPVELDIIANIARYHRKSHPSPRHLPFGQLSSAHQEVVCKLSAILRVADALDYGRQSRVREIQCRKKPDNVLAIRLCGAGDMTDEIRSAADKSALMSEVYGMEIVFE
jgi:exopolyphosphatase/guanosine-5'-triphosphate,3'-diphosphate pyrophosphatase